MSEQFNQTNVNAADIDPTPIALGGPTFREQRTLRLIGIEGLRITSGEGTATVKDGQGEIFVGPLRRTEDAPPLNQEAS